jgi:hypothetical protein
MNLEQNQPGEWYQLGRQSQDVLVGADYWTAKYWSECETDTAKGLPFRLAGVQVVV